ncbi:hypothetical protein [Cryobacterium cryoconiti]|uniref:Uncharacterized protein n=1 Tax=Cryobacterium cryoconiti TaxID=1259239 RepID=A0A4Y8JS79_9MICO|nr:hypothetical protein [Cryobacterium cryoconiti]TFD27524.1 hypothetical protein E3T49_13360 [Cryobacterium cryoconiti]
MGVAPRRLNGWEPAEVTEYEHVDGVLVRSITRCEAEFDDEQRELLLASAEFEASIDSNGHFLAETMSPEADPMNYKSTLRFTAAGPFFNYAEKARLDDVDRYRAEFPKDSPPNLNGAYWVVEKHGELAGDPND